MRLTATVTKVEESAAGSISYMISFRNGVLYQSTVTTPPVMMPPSAPSAVTLFQYKPRISGGAKEAPMTAQA